MLRKYAFLGLLVFLLLSLLAVLGFLLLGFNKNINFLPTFIENTEASTDYFFDSDENLTWQEELARWPQRDYSPAAPVFSMHFDADTSELREKSKYFQLIINEYDLYSLFCLRQTLNAFEVKYFMLNAGKAPQIFLDTSNQNLLKEIIQELQKYKIHTQIKEIWL